MKNIASNIAFNIYLLYPTNRDDEGNFYRLLQNYINIGIELQAYLIDWEKMDGLPKSNLYVPADHEVFMHRAYKNKLLTKEQISFINCEIIGASDLLILFGRNGVSINNDDISTELQYVRRENIPIYTMPDLSPMAIDALKLAIKLIVKSEG